MADRTTTKNSVKFITLIVILVFIAVLAIMIGSCGSGNDTDQLGTDEPLSVVVQVARTAVA